MSGVLSLLKTLVHPAQFEEGQRVYEHRYGVPGVFLSLKVVEDVIKELDGVQDLRAESDARHVRIVELVALVNKLEDL